MSRRAPRLRTRRVAAAVLASASVAGLVATAASAAPTPASAASATPVLGAATTPPPIKHVWVIQLENKSYDESFVNNNNTYLWNTLPKMGVLLRQYYGTGHFSLDNYIAQLSGQGTNADTKADCQMPIDVTPGTVTPHVAGALGTAADVNADQVVGQGCVYPKVTPTLVNQLDNNGLTWKGYMEDMGLNPAREQTACGLPVANGQAIDPTANTTKTPPASDGTQAASAADQYAARHNPFIFFHSVIDNMTSCMAHVVPLVPLASATPKANGLAQDLASVSTTPNFNYITPNLCNDAHDTGCAGNGADGTKTGGLVAADAFLSKYVPMITGSDAFKQDGMLIVTFDEGNPTSQSPMDLALGAASCCNEPASINGGANGTNGNGGGQTGTVVVSKYTTPNTISDTGYNHYSLLRSLEDLYGITTGGTDGKGHLGYAAMPVGAYAPTSTMTSATSAFVPFGTDVYSNPTGVAQSGPNPVVSESPWAVGLPVVGLAAAGALMVRRRRSGTTRPA